MFQDLITATNKIINSRFKPYNTTLYGTSRQFEVYLNNLLMKQLGAQYTRNSVSGFGRRLFDIKIHDPAKSQWKVCEIGHERSSRDYLNTPKGRINKMGLINKLFFDYIKNYKYPKLVPISFAYLYFSFENDVNIVAANNLFQEITNMLPHNHNYHQQDVIINKVQKGIILIIDGFTNFNNIRDMYQNNPQIHQYVNPIERGWYKHEILMGIR